MKIIVIVILAGLIIVPIVSGTVHGFDWGIWSFIGLIAFLALLVIVINKAKGTKLF